MSKDPVMTKLDSIEHKLDVLISKFDLFIQGQVQKRAEPQPQIQQVSRIFTDRAKHVIARYPGRCKVCGEAINVGEPIVFEAGKGAAHETCV